MDDEHFAAYLLYGCSLLLVLGPLLHILWHGRFAAYFVYSLTALSFLVMNLIGSVTGNIFATGQILPLQFSLFAISSVLAFTYPVLVTLRAGRTPPLHDPQALAVMAAASKSVRRYALSLLALVALVVVYFSAKVSLPLFLRVDLFGQWERLIQLRMDVVFGGHKFHWFSLAYFAIPQFLTCLALLMWQACKRADYPGEANRWRRLSFLLVPVSVLLSISFLHKTYLAYLLAAIFLVFAVVGGRVMRLGVIAFAVVMLSAVPLYIIYMGFSAANASVAATLLWHRIFEVYPWAAAVSLNVFPDIIPFLNGKSFINFFKLFPYEQVNVAPIIYPYIYEGATGGGAPLPALYEMYANFGWLGFAAGLPIIPAYIVAVSLMSWSRNPVVQALAFFLVFSGLVHLWEAAFWFGALEPTLIVLALFLGGFWWLMKHVRLYPALLSIPNRAVRPSLVRRRR